MVKKSKGEGIMNKKKLKEFYELLEKSSLSDVEKKDIIFIAEYFSHKHNPALSSRSFLFQGDVGVGKTYLAEKLLAALEKEVVTLGCADFSFKNTVKCSYLGEIPGKISNDKEQIIFLDDLNSLFKSNEYGVDSEDKRDFMKILETVKRNPKKLLICTINEMSDLDDRMIDRIEVITSFEVPTEINKKEFLQNKFKTFMTSELVELVSHNSIGYNYRDLPEMIKLAYRLGNSTISQESVKKALRIYRPTQLYGFSVYNGINTTLADVIGKKEAVKTVKRLVHIYKNEHLSQQLGLKRANLLLFQGQAGTGKTFMAKALAGELGFPLISAKAGGFDMGVFETIQRITKLAKRYRNCVLFIDEAEKMFGNPRFEEDNMVLGELQRCLEGADGKEIRSVVILAVNDLDRFGEGIQDRFNIIKFNLPSYEDRLEFCKSKVENAKEKLKQEIDYNYLAQKTKDMSFREIDRFWNDLMFHYLENKNEINNETIAYLIKASGKEETDSMFG